MAATTEKPPTPASLGYAMPAEWRPHDATWLSWPHNRETWPTQLAEVQDVWVDMIRALSAREQVHLLVNDEVAEREVSAVLRSAGVNMAGVAFLRIPTVDVWIRDYGPTFVVRQQTESPLAFNDWIFNGWGGKYASYERDDGVAQQVALRLKVPVFRHPIVLEGGSIEVNGRGTCLTTEQCLLNKNRNPGLDRTAIENWLENCLGVSRVVWLGEGVAGDDTDGHIDDLARFVDETTIVCVTEDDPRDENYVPLRENYRRLRESTDQDGRRFSVVPLPCPRPVYAGGMRLPASYANFYIANGLVLVPLFDDPNDAKAVAILKELFPDREIVGLACAPVVAGLGAIHCVTQQQPRV